ncbi:CPBP family intramembrane metalloprotease [Occultella glacieicola]|uniref:CPBP family intramembrane metalloprotease n=1 Tax=Occultella glacieicola TaxID=2518684 RepID=A0ABY2E3S8_9MICO|nr:CPBP family intramembrane glutamic endopeptidase [Occultella glacieicola]TDE89664.1 CPBP family intramembrane metalloprotease [Occultella glacieicola]
MSIVMGAIMAICAVFLAVGATIPEWFVIAGRWLPALVSLLVLRVVALPGGPVRWWALRAGGWRQLLGGSALTILALLTVYVLSVLPVLILGTAQPQPAAALGQVALALIPTIVLFSLSTFGEEVGWRGFLQRTLADRGFWRASLTVAAAWAAFHVPLHGAMAIQGTIPWLIAATSTVGLIPLGLFLSAAVVRFGSVWPAVFAHAVPLSALNLISNAGDLPPGTHWILTAVTAVLLTGAAALLARRQPAADSARNGRMPSSTTSAIGRVPPSSNQRSNAAK